MKNLDLPNLLQLNLSGNEIKHIENLQGLPRLENLDLHSNKLTSISNITLLPNKTLRVFSAAHNLLPLSSLEDIEYALSHEDQLVELDLSSNEVSLHNYYRIKIYEFKNIKKLDNRPIDDFLRDYMKEVKQKDLYRNLVEETRAEYLKRIKKETDVKN